MGGSRTDVDRKTTMESLEHEKARDWLIIPGVLADGALLLNQSERETGCKIAEDHVEAG